MRKFLLLLSLPLYVSFSFWQLNITSWTKSVNIANSEDYIYDVLQLPDTGYILAGSYRSAAKPFSDFLLVRTDKYAGLQGMIGAIANIRNLCVAMEYNMAKVNSLSFKPGYNFRLWLSKNQ